MGDTNGSFFSKLPIHKQISLGICGISFCIFSLIFALIVMLSFVMVNYLYYDAKKKYYYLDIRFIETVTRAIEVDIKISKYMALHNQQTIRNFIEVTTGKEDFIAMYDINQDKINNVFIYYDKTSDECNRNKYNCFVYRRFGKQYTEADNRVLMDYKKVFFIMRPLLNFSSKVNCLSPNTNLMSSFAVLSPKYKNLIYYPYKEYNEKFTEKSMNEFIYTLLDDQKDEKISPLKKMVNPDGHLHEKAYTNNSLIYPGIFNYEFLKNPFILIFMGEEDNKPFKSNFETLDYFELSLKFSKTRQNPKELLNINDYFKLDNLDNVFVGEFDNKKIYEFFLNSVSDVYLGTQIFITSSLTNINIKPMKCVYFLKLYEVEQGLNNYEKMTAEQLLKHYNVTNLSSVFDCFIGNVKEKLMKYFSLATPNLVRRTDLKLFENLNYNYKVFKKLIPSLETNLQVNSPYLETTPTNIYLLRNLEYQKGDIDNMYHHFIAKEFQIMWINIVICVSMFIIILIFTSRMASKISMPIKILVNAINSMGKSRQSSLKNSSKEDDLLDSIESISYPEDKDINDLFQICKVLIKGAFSASTESDETYDRLEKQFTYLKHAYNNVSYIKTNNFIIEEDSMEKAYNHQAGIFNYEESNKNLSMDDGKLLELLRKDNFVEAELGEKESILEKERKEIFDLVEIYSVDYESHPYYEYYQASDLRILSL